MAILGLILGHFSAFWKALTFITNSCTLVSNVSFMYHQINDDWPRGRKIALLVDEVVEQVGVYHMEIARALNVVCSSRHGGRLYTLKPAVKNMAEKKLRGAQQELLHI